MYFPTRIKQISLLPSDVMLVWWDGDEHVYRDAGAVIGYIAVIDGNKEDDYGNIIDKSGDSVEIGTIGDEGYGEIEQDFFYNWRIIPSYKCPQCGNKMSIKPFAHRSEMTYYCRICGRETSALERDKNDGLGK